MNCSTCGDYIEDTYYKCLDNFIQVKFFDTEEENIFCSQECFCKYLNLEEFDVEDEKNDKCNIKKNRIV